MGGFALRVSDEQIAPLPFEPCGALRRNRLERAPATLGPQTAACTSSAARCVELTDLFPRSHQLRKPHIGQRASAPRIADMAGRVDERNTTSAAPAAPVTAGQAEIRDRAEHTVAG